jgi:glycosyltransferase involved in cell wall biosynthesis
MRPLFTVVIPTRNRPAFLPQAVASVLSQSQPAEVLVVDDGEGAAATLSGHGERVIVLDNQRRGPVAARNLGVGRARTPFIAFLDDDDWFCDRDHLAMAATALAEGAGLSFSNGHLVFDDGSPPLLFSFGADARSLEADNTILISAVAYRRDLHDAIGRFDEALPYYWDWDWYLRVARSGARLAHIARPTVSIRVHGGNMSGVEQEAARRANLDRLAAKHQLPPIPLKNHLSLARGG